MLLILQSLNFQTPQHTTTTTMYFNNILAMTLNLAALTVSIHLLSYSANVNMITNQPIFSMTNSTY